MSLNPHVDWQHALKLSGAQQAEDGLVDYNGQFGRRKKGSTQRVPWQRGSTLDCCFLPFPAA